MMMVVVGGGGEGWGRVSLINSGEGNFLGPIYTTPNKFENMPFPPIWRTVHTKTAFLIAEKQF